MALTIKLTSVTEHPDGRFECIFEINGAGGMGRVWASKQDATDATRPPLESEDALIGYLLARWDAVSANYTNPAPIFGKILTVDFTKVNAINIS